MIVKSLTNLLAVLLIAIQFAGATKKPTPESTIPPWTFASIEEMTQWGKSSAFGGGSVSEPCKLGEHTVYIVNRMHTSGMLTSELSIYALNQDGKGLSLSLFQPARYMGIETRLVDNRIVCVSKDPGTGKTEAILTITPELFDIRRFSYQ